MVCFDGAEVCEFAFVKDALRVFDDFEQKVHDVIFFEM